jgi:hypothetical protein
VTSPVVPRLVLQSCVMKRYLSISSLQTSAVSCKLWIKGAKSKIGSKQVLLCWQLFNLAQNRLDGWKAEGRGHHWLPSPGCVPSQLKSPWTWAPANLGVWCKACSGVQIILTVPGRAFRLQGDVVSLRSLGIGSSKYAFSEETLKSHCF